MSYAVRPAKPAQHQSFTGHLRRVLAQEVHGRVASASQASAADFRAAVGGKLDSADQGVEWLSISADPADKFSGINEWPSNLRSEAIVCLQKELDKISANLVIADFGGRGKGLVTLKVFREGEPRLNLKTKHI